VRKLRDIGFDKLLLIPAMLFLSFVMGYIVYINFAYYWSHLHFDIATDLAFVREARVQGTLFPDGWLHLREVRLAHITSVVLLVYTITGNLHLSYPIAVSLMLLVNVCLFYYMVSFRKVSPLAVVMGVLSLLVLFAFMNARQCLSIFTILFVNGSYALHLSAVLFTLGVYMRQKTREKRVSIALWGLMAAVAFVQGVQSNRLLIGLYLPILLVELWPILMDLLDNKPFRLRQIEKSTMLAALGFSCALAGILFMQFLFRRGIVISYYTNAHVDLTLIVKREFGDRLLYFIHQATAAFGLRGGIRVFSLDGMVYFGRLFVLVVTLTAFSKMKAGIGKANVDNVLVRVLFVSICCLSFVMLLTEMEIAARHIFTAVVWISVILVFVIDHFVRQKQWFLTAMACAAVCFISAAAMVTFPLAHNTAMIEDRQRVADFIVEQELTIGYGTIVEGETIAAVADFAFHAITIDDRTFYPIPRGVTMAQLHHEEERVFFISVGWLVQSEMAREFLESGERHDFPGGWVVYIFEENPWRELHGMHATDDRWRR